MLKIFIYILSFIICSSQLFANKHKYVEWKLALNWKSTLAPLSSPSFAISKIVREMSNGKFTIKIDGLEKHQSSNLENMIQKNQYQMIHSDSSLWKKLDINTIWFTGIPFGMTRKEHLTWFYYGDGQQYMSQVYGKFNLLAFPGGDLGSLMGGWSNKEILSSSDFNDLQVNTKGITSEILSMYNANIKDISRSKINNAFINNKLDFITATSPSMDIKMGYHKIASYYYTSWDKPSAQTQFLINKTAYEELSPQYKTILNNAIKIASYDLYYENFYESLKALEKIQNEFTNVQIKSLPKSVLQDLEKSKKLIFEQYSKENKMFKEIYSNQKTFLKRARKWSEIEEYSYIKSLESLKK